METLNTTQRVCPHCRCETVQEVRIRTDGVHYADAICTVCNRHAGFPPKPDNDPTKYRRPNAHRNLVQKFSRGFCEMCLVQESDLPKGRQLEAQHVVEFRDGGEPRRENVWIVCTGCHKMIHWLRTYQLAPEHREAVQDLAEGATAWKQE